jgi:hypothetical protein
VQPSGEDFGGRYRSHYQRLVQGSAISETFSRHDPRLPSTWPTRIILGMGNLMMVLAKAQLSMMMKLGRFKNIQKSDFVSIARETTSTQ